jgi:hypothetical protein
MLNLVETKPEPNEVRPFKLQLAVNADLADYIQEITSSRR